MEFLLYSGLVADIDIESEKYRCLGSARIDFYVCFLVVSHLLFLNSTASGYFVSLRVYIYMILSSNYILSHCA